MGANASQLEKEIGADQFPPNEHYIGLVNFGNTCYINSVLQALYFCKPFREKILEYKAKNKRTKETLLACLADLFYSIATQKKKVGSIAPKKFIARFRKENGEGVLCYVMYLFIYYIFVCASLIFFYRSSSPEKQLAGRASGRPGGGDGEQQAGGGGQQDSGGGGGNTQQQQQHQQQQQENTWVHEIFQAVVTRELRCLNCEAVRSTDEVLNNLSVEVHQNTSITHCLRCFFSTETISAENKVLCENCCSLQEHQKRTRVKKLPTILVLHLKRFQFLGQYNRTLKLSHRVVFPLELRVFDTSSDAVNPDRLYDLAAVVVHCGTGINRGHYIAIVKSHRFWLLFDDDAVDKIDPSVMEEFYGLTSELQKSSETGYILFYQARDPT
ncbi:ubiquitin carboxyl-terminal hydrolase 46-like [Eriocheir sinensis]|uniref:ubiquitin carboxyl-terminal hydrolase 46-like n=1 Tax=Eriocheir sinensis TaxID=95602 RepID=UPI0021CAA86A|nr:ubiquitin carboxyl-terminal hydrolase 46-like [Eriocheir sinensis]